MALLPPIARFDTIAVIARNHSGEIVGAGGIAWHSVGHPPGFPSWIQVLPDSVRQGVGTALAQALQDIARDEAPALWAAKPLPSGSPGALFAESVGYACQMNHVFFRADSATFLRAMEKLWNRMIRRNPDYENMRLSRVTQANLEEVWSLVEHHIEGASPSLRGDLIRSFDLVPATAPVDLARSTVLEVSGRPIGALLTKRLPDRVNTQIIGRVVAPHYRSGWVNIALLTGTTAALVADGCAWFEFDCAEHVTDTVRLAQKGEATRIRTEGLYRQAIAGTAA